MPIKRSISDKLLSRNKFTGEPKRLHWLGKWPQSSKRHHPTASASVCVLLHNGITPNQQSTSQPILVYITKQRPHRVSERQRMQKNITGGDYLINLKFNHIIPRYPFSTYAPGSIVVATKSRVESRVMCETRTCLILFIKSMPNSVGG